MTDPNRITAMRPMALISLLALGACTEPLDFDVRGQFGAFNTTEAARGARTADRPAPDSRGLITYPNYQVAVARRGDTVTTVAARLGVNAAELGRFNGIDPEVPLRNGEVLALPRPVPSTLPGGATPGSVDIAALAGQAIDSAPDTTPVQTTALAPAATVAPPVQPGPEPVRHKVERGETAYTIARLYNVPVKSLAQWNGLGSDFAIREGQYLLIPIAEASSSSTAVASATAATAVTQPGSGSPTPTPPSATTPLPDEKVAAASQPVDVPETRLANQTKPSDSGAMAYPVTGKVIRGYKKGRNDGIDIAAAPGTPVRAAADGTVAAITQDADNVPIVVVRHEDSLLTVYANVTGIKVNKDDRVSRGEPIAVLRDGDAAYVHFEVRQGFDSVDPAPYLD